MNHQVVLLKKVCLLISISFMVAAFFFWKFSSPAESAPPKIQSENNLEIYDIRTDQKTAAKKSIDGFIEQSAKTAAIIDSDRKQIRKAEIRLREKVPGLKVEYNRDLRIPEVISPEAQLKSEFISAPSGEKRARILRDFIAENSGLFGLDEIQISRLKTTADYTNPNGVLSFVQFEQEIGGVPVFRGEIKAGFTKENEIIRVINNLAPNLVEENLSNDFGNAEQAVRNAAKQIGFEANENDAKRVDSTAGDLKITFERGQFEDRTTAEKIYFPITSGVARPAWRVLLWTKEAAFYVIVDAADGTLLWRKNLTENQTSPATYNVYGNSTSMSKTADSPSPFTPGCFSPLCAQPPIIARTDFTLIGNEPPYNFNNNGWIPDGENRTIGNNVEAGIDRDTTQGIDDNGWAFGNPNRVFSYAYNPAPGNPAPGEEPLPATQTYPPSAFQQGSVTQAFYAVNRWHDETYRLGFNEVSRNFQTDNFGRGGIGNDSLSVEVQDINLANFSTTADGSRGRLQIGVWTAPTPDRDGALDNQIVFHEATHGLTNRLHGNASGLSSNMARAMGEGWSDFYALALLSEPNDNRLGTHTIGGYASYLAAAGFESNYYYGLRRYPVSSIASTGGTNNKPHNALTFSYLNSNCNARLNETNFAFPRGPIGTTTCDQVNNGGEIWTVALWEMRDKLIGKHGAAEGNRRSLQYVTDAMKFAPLNPTFLQERDAILFAAQAGDPDDVAQVWQGFALRGMGFSASIQNAGTGANNTVVSEAFDSPNVTMTNPFSVVEQQGNGNGLTEMGEVVSVTVTLTNPTGITVNNVSATIRNGFSENYGNLAPGQTVSRQIRYYVPRRGTCDSMHQINIDISSDLGTRTETRSFQIIHFLPGTVFTNNTLINVPNGQPSTTSGAASPYPSIITVSGVAGNRVPKVELTNVAHTWLSDVDVMLESPGGQKYVLFSDAYNQATTVSGTFTFSDAAAAIPSNNGQPVPGLYKPTNYTAGDLFASPAPAGPYNEAAPAGSATFASAFGIGGAGANGDWKLWVVDDTNSDSGTIGGWKLSFEPPTGFCIDIFPTAMPPNFDNDYQTDVSVFRPSDGNWYLNRSQSGFTAINWGVATDKIVPADYDGDQKTDAAVFRNGNWLILNSSNNTFTNVNWGVDSDILVPGDYDGDGRSDQAVFRPSDGTWYIRKSSNGTASFINFGQNGDVPVPADYDGDFRTDPAVFRNGNWYLQQSFFGFEAVAFGLPTDKLVPMDYDYDGRADIAVFRPENGTWYRLNSTNKQFSAISFGQNGDIPVPGDYDGDFRADQAVYRNGNWYINGSNSGFKAVAFGTAGDKPLPAAYIP